MFHFLWSLILNELHARRLVCMDVFAWTISNCRSWVFLCARCSTNARCSAHLSYLWTTQYFDRNEFGKSWVQPFMANFFGAMAWCWAIGEQEICTAAGWNKLELIRWCGCGFHSASWWTSRRSHVCTVYHRVSSSQEMTFNNGRNHHLLLAFPECAGYSLTNLLAIWSVLRWRLRRNTCLRCVSDLQFLDKFALLGTYLKHFCEETK